jgi:hypothetical protein
LREKKKENKRIVSSERIEKGKERGRGGGLPSPTPRKLIAPSFKGVARGERGMDRHHKQQKNSKLYGLREMREA